MTEVHAGNIIYSGRDKKLICRKQGFVVLEDGLVEGVYPVVPQEYRNAHLIDHGKALIIPAFSDLHLHAPQFYQRGVGMDRLLLDWLDTYTFPQEGRFSDLEYAGNAYEQFTSELIRQGTLQAAVYATVHYESTSILFDIFEKKGLYGYIGKLNMDQRCPEYLKEETLHSLKETERFICEHSGSKRVRPIITPRFAISCSEPLIEGLGRLVKRYQVPFQTHLCESLEERKSVSELFSSYSFDAQIYERYGLFDSPLSLLAHCIYLEPEDIRVMKDHGAVAVHCPDSNINVTAGLMPARRLLGEELTIALGSDIGGGHEVPIYRAIARAIQVSKLRGLLYGKEERLSLEEAFYFATRSAGECFGQIGAFEKGYHFNALIIDDSRFSGPQRSLAERLERFCYIGDDRDITERYVDGKLLEP